jgi:hypothetical protein
MVSIGIQMNTMISAFDKTFQTPPNFNFGSDLAMDYFTGRGEEVTHTCSFSSNKTSVVLRGFSRNSRTLPTSSSCR